jgi:anti-anti-sigma regulatory factor
VRGPDDRPTTVTLVVADGSEVVVGCVDARRPDIALVGALARLQLCARRRGCSMRVGDPSPELRGLLELAGLTEVLGLEPRRQTELGEQVGVEEVVKAPDPPA